LIKHSLNGEINKINIRPTVWKLFLNVLPLTGSIDEWYSRTKSQRIEYRNKMKSLTALKKFNGDPLGGQGEVVLITIVLELIL
jgi:hypothetical protein